MEESTRYEVQRQQFSDEEMTGFKEIFQKIGRQQYEFITGDIIVSVENRLQQVGSELSKEEAQKLLESDFVKSFYPAEASINLK